MAFADSIGYPVIVRPAYTLGGTGGGIAYDEASLREIAARRHLRLPRGPDSGRALHLRLEGDRVRGHARQRGQRHSPICSMENIDPVGVHTGDSIVVAPTQTLANKEYQMLRYRRAGHYLCAGDRGRLQLPVRAEPRLL